MSTLRKTLVTCGAAAAAAIALVACSDTFTAAPRQVDTAPPSVANREIPAQYAWVGEEHNRFVTVALGEYDFARLSGDRARRNAFQQDCGALWDLMSREVYGSARAGGFEGRERDLLAIVRAATPPADGCARHRPTALTMFAGSPASMRWQQVEATNGGPPWELVAAMLSQISVARTPADVRRIIGDAAATASALQRRDAEVAYAMLALIRGSFEHWSAVLPARRLALSLFMQDTATVAGGTTEAVSWGGILATVSADAAGCTSGARAVRNVDGSAGWSSVAGGCLIGGGVASAGAAIGYK